MMKQEDIDKKIGMPDVDKEWAQFEREVIGKAKASRKPLYWGLGIAASIALVAGIFIFGHDAMKPQQAIVQQKMPSSVEEKAAAAPDATKAVVEKGVPAIGEAKQRSSSELLARATPPSKEDNALNCGEVMPYFPGGDRALQEFIKNNLHFPDLALEYGVKGRVIMTGKIDTIGQASDFKPFKYLLSYDTLYMNRVPAERRLALKQQIDSLLGEECIRVLSLMPRWTPGSSFGKTMSVKYTIPITFKATNDERQTYLAQKQGGLQGRIAGLGDGHLNIRFVSRDSRPAVPLSEHDTILVLVNGKEDRDFLQYLSRMPNDSSVYDYFFSKNQLLVHQTLPSKKVQAALYAPTLFEGRDIRLVVDYLTVPFTPVAQLTADEIKSRRMDYLLKSYRAGFSRESSKEYYSPDLYDTPVRERLFGLLATEYDKWGVSKDEHFGPVGSDSHGIYVPLVRNVVLKSQDDAWYEDGEVVVLADDPRFNSLVNDIRRAAAQAESSIVSGDSIVRMAFICGGKVEEGQPHDLMSDMQRPLYQKVKESTFHFLPYEDAPSYWWGEVYYSTTSQRHLWMQLYSVDKLYAADCPELLSNRRHVEGVVMDEKNVPLSGACVNISSSRSLQDGVITDSNGHFELWLPFPDATIGVNCPGYKYHIVHPADTTLTIRMQDATLLKDVKVIPKEASLMLR